MIAMSQILMKLDRSVGSKVQLIIFIKFGLAMTSELIRDWVINLILGSKYDVLFFSSYISVNFPHMDLSFMKCYQHENWNVALLCC